MLYAFEVGGTALLLLIFPVLTVGVVRALAGWARRLLAQAEVGGGEGETEMREQDHEGNGSSLHQLGEEEEEEDEEHPPEYERERRPKWER